MQKSLRTVTITLLSLLALSCSNKEEQNVKQLDIWTDTASVVYSSELASSVRYIRLEQPQNGILTQVYRMKPYNNQLYILDKNTECIYRYSSDGKFLNITNNFGKGPLEIRVANDFFIDSANRCIEVLSVGKILTYNMELEPVKELYNNIALGEQSFYKVNSREYLLFADNYPYRPFKSGALELIDTSGKLLQTFVDNSDLLYLNTYLKNTFNTYKNKIVFNRSFTNAILEFDLSSMKARVRYRVNFKNFKFPSGILERYKKETDKDAVSTNYLLDLIKISNSGKYADDIYNLFESDEYLVFIYSLSSTPIFFTVLYDKANDKLTSSIIKNDLGEYEEFGKPIWLDGKMLYTYLTDPLTEQNIIAIYELK